MNCTVICPILSLGHDSSYWVDTREMKHFFKFFSTFAIKDYIQHIILIPNGSFSLKTFKFKYFKAI